jgi:hypothetical protein
MRSRQVPKLVAVSRPSGYFSEAGLRDDCDFGMPSPRRPGLIAGRNERIPVEADAVVFVSVAGTVALEGFATASFTF